MTAYRFGGFQKLLDTGGEVVHVAPEDDEVLFVAGADVGAVQEGEAFLRLFRVVGEDLAEDRAELGGLFAEPCEQVLVRTVAGEDQQDRLVGRFAGLVEIESRQREIAFLVAELIYAVEFPSPVIPVVEIGLGDTLALFGREFTRFDQGEGLRVVEQSALALDVEKEVAPLFELVIQIVDIVDDGADAGGEAGDLDGLLDRVEEVRAHGLLDHDQDIVVGDVAGPAVRIQRLLLPPIPTGVAAEEDHHLNPLPDAKDLRDPFQLPLFLLWQVADVGLHPGLFVLIVSAEPDHTLASLCGKIEGRVLPFATQSKTLLCVLAHTRTFLVAKNSQLWRRFTHFAAVFKFLGLRQK